MTKFFQKIFLFALILGLILFAANEFMFKKRQEGLKENAWAAIIDKHARLDSLKSPRIILVGGSNIMFGLSAKMLEDTFKLPTENMGLGGALGLDFMLNEALDVARKGDKIILSTEYLLDKGDNGVLLYLEDVFPTAKKYVHFDNKIDEFRANVLYRTNGIRNAFLLADVNQNVKIEDTVNVYFRTAFNKQGDIMSHLNNPKPSFLRDKNNFNQKSRYTSGIEKLNDFAQKLNAKGATIVFTFPSQPQSFYDDNKEFFDNLAIDMQKQAKFKVLDTPASMVLPDSLFFDTTNHPISEGREIRTSRLIRELKTQEKTF